MSKVISICNQKGGTGKTTSSINIAACLALTGNKVLLIDLDPQANATSGVGLDKHTVVKSSYHILLDEVAVSDVVQPTAIELLKVIPSNLDLTGAEVELVGTLGREYRLKKALQKVRDEYDYIIIDSPPSLGLLTINGLCAADSVIIPVQCEYYALEGLTQLTKTVELVKENLNPNLSIEGVLLTMADYRTNLTKEVILEARKYFKEKVYKTVIPRNIRLTEAPSFGKPIALYDKESLGAQRYEEFCKELINMQQTQTEVAHDGA